MAHLTKEEFQSAVPAALRGSVNDVVLDHINNIIDTPDTIDAYKNNLLSYVGILSKGRFKVADYVNAVTYVSYKLMDMTNREAFRKTFPNRYRDWEDRELPLKKIDSYVSQYNKGKLVNMIWAETMIPVHVFNHGMFQNMLNEAASIAINGKSEIARVQAIGQILTHTKPPETKKIELDLGVQDNVGGVIDQLREATQRLSDQQLTQLNKGQVTIKRIAEAEIVDKEIEE